MLRLSGFVHLRRILRALNLHKKIEYTARIAPAQLGKATVNRHRKPAATGWTCFSGLGLSADMGMLSKHRLSVAWLLSYDWMLGDGVEVASVSVKAPSMPGKTS